MERAVSWESGDLAFYPSWGTDLLYDFGQVIFPCWASFHIPNMRHVQDQQFIIFGGARTHLRLLRVVKAELCSKRRQADLGSKLSSTTV